MSNIVVLYHANCTDGFGGAYVAWKKFGEEASYIPVSHQEPYPEEVENAEVYIIDFCYPKEIILEIKEVARSVTVIDHHAPMKEAAEAASVSLFDISHSGAALAWQYFFPDKPTPKLIRYIEDDDLYQFKLQYAREVLAVIFSTKHEFTAFQNLETRFENEKSFQEIVEKGTHYREHWEHLVQGVVERADLVSFEGHEVYAAKAPGIFASDVGNALATMCPPIGITWSANTKYIKVSLRSVGDVDVSEIARRYGGGGNFHTAAFRLEHNFSLPFTKIES